MNPTPVPEITSVLPPASTWGRYPELAFVVLLAAAFVVVLVYYSNYNDKRWREFTKDLTTEFINAIRDQRQQEITLLERIDQHLEEHDRRSAADHAALRERSAPIGKRGLQ